MKAQPDDFPFFFFCLVWEKWILYLQIIKGPVIDFRVHPLKKVLHVFFFSFQPLIWN